MNDEEIIELGVSLFEDLVERGEDYDESLVELIKFIIVLSRL